MGIGFIFKGGVKAHIRRLFRQTLSTDDPFVDIDGLRIEREIPGTFQDAPANAIGAML